MPDYVCDIYNPIITPSEDTALCNTLEFDKYTLDKTILRPWGPGIISEVVFYMAVHLGVKSICTLGWDLTISDKVIEGKHFYDNVLKKSDMINPARIGVEKETQRKDVLLSEKTNSWLQTKKIELTTASKHSNIHIGIQRVNLEQTNGIFEI